MIQVNMTEEQRNSLLQIIQGSSFAGRDAERIIELKNMLLSGKKEEKKKE